ncbi:MAG: hypothetical protein QOI24_3169 [Acidobacteriota bacterium]|jgi:tetratricopeptide (TPR) repeat protein|nr:hypothetical protein [Acidobacteriota bacterium]
MTWHPTDEELDDYVIDSPTLPPEDRHRIERHLETCEACSEVAAGALDLANHLNAAETWRARPIATGPPSPRRFLDQVEQIRISDEAANYLLAHLITSPDAFEAAHITDDPNYHTAGVVRKLIKASERTRETEPSFAIVLANAAVVIAELLLAPHYTRELIHSLQGAAWRERANALRYTGRYPDALAACDRAEAAFRLIGVSDFDTARVTFIRGTLLMETGHPDEALPLARASAAIFRRWHDDERLIDAGLLEGGILFEKGDGAGALAVFLALVPAANTLDDAETSARLENNIAAAYQATGDFVAAASHYQIALALYAHLAMVVETLRTSWSVALLALQRGDRADGMKRLARVGEAFEQRGILIEAALVAMDRAREHVRAREFDPIVELCAHLAQRFVAAGMYAHADEALAFLRGAAASGNVDDAVVDHARAYFRGLKLDPALLFVRPTR